ncbi:MAG: mechanosensitive ion channel [Candidatus Hydrogenedentes bacterium]|nr:mechanosensitive ion channel [Candidatus Hydrogenedentota bacterium]
MSFTLPRQTMNPALRGNLPFRIAALLACVILCALPAFAQLSIPGAGDAPEIATEAAPAEPTVDERLAELRTQVDALDTRIDAAAAAETPEQAEQLGVPLTTLQELTLSLRQLRSVYQDQIAALEQLQEVRRMREDLERVRTEYQGPAQPPPYTPWFVDTFRDAVSAKEVQLELDKQSLAIAKNRLTRTLSEQSKAEAALAQARSQAAASSDPAELRSLESKVQSAQAAVRLLQATVPLHDAQIQVAQERAALREQQLEFERVRLADAEERERYREEDLETKKEELASAREELQAQLNEAIEEKDEAQRALTDAREAQTQAANGETVAPADSLDLLRIRANAANDRAKMLRDRFDFLLYEEEMWTTRYKLHLGNGELTVADELQRAQDYADGLNSILQTRTADLEVVRAALREWERKAREPEQAGDADLAQQIVPVLNGHLDLFRSGLTALTTQQQVNKHLLGELRKAQDRLSIGERIRQVWDATARIWYQELPIKLGDEPLTFRQLVVATIILIVGIAVIRVLRRYFRALMRSRTRFDANATANLERLLFYVLVIVIVLVAMNIVGIPLTAFTIFGGALAIGVGFGAQNLINNFISGLILMMERPIRIGDLVEVDDRAGFIEEIGARCSRLRQFSGVDILVPNSAFLEKTVINWTLSDAKVRWEIRVGVAYGSDTRQAQKLILKAVEEHGRVLEDPEPLVVFSEFGDSALIFDAYFWLTVGPATDSRVVRSDIRHRIDKLFREAGIVIAFPQRDVHLDVTGPLDVRVTNGNRSSDQGSARRREREEIE